MHRFIYWPVAKRVDSVCSTHDDDCEATSHATHSGMEMDLYHSSEYVVCIMIPFFVHQEAINQGIGMRKGGREMWCSVTIR